MGSLTSFISNAGMKAQGDGTVDLDTDNIDIILVGDKCDVDDEDVYVSDIGTLDELSVSGYVPGHGNGGRQALGSVSLSIDNPNDRVKIDATNPTWSTLAIGGTIAGYIICKRGTSDDTDAQILGLWAFAADIPTNGSDVAVNFSSVGFLLYTRS